MNMMMQQMISKGQLPPNMTAQQQVCVRILHVHFLKQRLMIS